MQSNIIFLLTVKARTAQLAKIKWVINIVFYILQVSKSFIRDTIWGLNPQQFDESLLRLLTND